MKVLLFISMTSLLVACSGSKSADESMDAGIELADAVEFSDVPEDVIGESVPETLEEPGMGVVAEDGIAPVEEVAQAPVDEMAPMGEAMSQPVQIDDMSEAPVAMTGEVASYTVKENETLMMVAFNIYGDYERWRDIQRMNVDVLGASTTITTGMQLKYKVPAQPFVFNPSGNPYLIVKGDTLGKVSQKTYGRPTHWKDIWDNNKPLIKDPNVIFAGFTIYTPVIEGRDVAFDHQ